ncbi:hypothetical protein SH917_23220, partial [Acinetobacter baumannii]|nr:hypothetical protein [Acinetobacter baumannii]
FKIFWKLRVLNSNIKYSSLYTLNSQIEEYLNTSHGFINAMLRKSGGEYSEIQKESKLLFDSLNESIELARKNNLKS